MSKQVDIADLVRAVRARVPMDAAQMLIKETPERIGAVFAELPQSLETVELHLNGFGYYQPGYTRMASPTGGQT